MAKKNYFLHFLRLNYTYLKDLRLPHHFLLCFFESGKKNTKLLINFIIKRIYKKLIMNVIDVISTKYNKRLNYFFFLIDDI